MTYQRIAIIGCGYVGSAVGEALVKAGHHVVGTTITPDRLDDLRAKGIAPALLDTADTDRVHEVLHDRDAVVLSVAAGRGRADYRKVYLGSANSVITAARGTPVKRIIYTSSVGVYGQDDGSWVDESSPTHPRDDNGRILLDTERALLDGAKTLGRGQTGCASVVRLSGIYGPGRDLTGRIKSFAGKKRDDGDAYLNLIHLDDIVAALTALLAIRYHGVLNLSDDRPLPRREFYDRIIAEAGLPAIQWISVGAPTKRGKRVRNVLIKRTLGLTLKHPTH